MGWRLELPAPPGILMLGLPDARAPGAASGRTVKPGEEPPWYKPLLKAGPIPECTDRCVLDQSTT